MKIKIIALTLCFTFLLYVHPKKSEAFVLPAAIIVADYLVHATLLTIGAIIAYKAVRAVNGVNRETFQLYRITDAIADTVVPSVGHLTVSSVGNYTTIVQNDTPDSVFTGIVVPVATTDTAPVVNYTDFSYSMIYDANGNAVDSTYATAFASAKTIVNTGCGYVLVSTGTYSYRLYGMPCTDYPALASSAIQVKPGSNSDLLLGSAKASTDITKVNDPLFTGISVSAPVDNGDGTTTTTTTNTNNGTTTITITNTSTGAVISQTTGNTTTITNNTNIDYARVETAVRQGTNSTFSDSGFTALITKMTTAFNTYFGNPFGYLETQLEYYWSNYLKAELTTTLTDQTNTVIGSIDSHIGNYNSNDFQAPLTSFSTPTIGQPYDTGQTAADIRTVFDTFVTNMKTTSLFSLPNMLGSPVGGGNPLITFNAGRYGSHSYDFSSSSWAAVIIVIRSFFLLAFSYVGIRIIILKR